MVTVRRRALHKIAATAGVATIAAVLMLALPGAAGAAIVHFAATIDGAQETPPNGSAGTGTGTFVMDTVANTLSISVTYSGLGSGTIAGHIHGYAGPGVPAGIVYGFTNPNSPINETWNFSESDEPQIIAGLTYVNIHTSGFPAGEIRGQILRVPSCGDGILDAGEDCDDGNTEDGDCCDASCQYDGAGSPCGDGLCQAGTCDGAGSCGDLGGIRSGCRSAQKSALLIKSSDPDTKDKLIFKWLKGEATTVEDLGTPAGTTSYALCIYAGTAAIAVATIPPSATLWSPTGSTGFKYKDASGSADGIQKIGLKSGAAGKAKALLKGKGANLPDPPAGPLALPVTAQLVNDANAVCYEGVFDSASVKKNDAQQFKAKTP